MGWHAGVRTGIGWPVLAGFVTLAVGFGGFGAWAALAPLEGAVIASGKVAVHGRNKVVQHLEGGIVKEILVEEGQTVKAGDPVLVLDDTAARSGLNRLKAQLVTFEAIEARALAERDGKQMLEFPKALTALADNPEIAKIIDDQTTEFEARIEKQEAELTIFEQRIAAQEEAITGHQTQRREVAEQIELIGEEKAAFEILLAKKLATKSRVSELKRAEADLKGREGQLTAQIAQAKETIAELREQIERTRGTRIETAAGQLTEARLKRSELVEQIRAAEDVSARVVVRAPVSGRVMNLTKYNSGAVIAAGQEIMEIVPEETVLLVEAEVRPQDIDEVRIGQKARLSFAAFDQNETPPVPGEVSHVSADRLEDERTGEAYFLVRLAIAPGPTTGLDPSEIGPGQPVDVFITTGERTFVSYLVEPLTKSLRRAIRES